jgi:hypothetical protein
MPGAASGFDELSAGQILGDEVAWQMSPAESGPEQIASGPEIVDQPLALVGNAALGLPLRGLSVTIIRMCRPKPVHGDGSGCR